MPPFGSAGFVNQLLSTNAVINGDCMISQISPVNTNTALNLALNGTHYNNVDNCPILSNGPAGTVNDSQRNDHPVLGARGFSKSVEVVNAVAPGNVIVAVAFMVEGFILSQFFNQICTLSFWVKSPKTGIHCVTVNNNVDASYTVEYIVAAANTWQRVQVGVPFIPGGGTWDFTSGLGMQVVFPLITGGIFDGAVNQQWSTTVHRFSTDNQQNLLDTIGNTFRVTDVVFNIGVIGLTFDRIPFDLELQRCQRYYQQSFNYGVAPAQAVGNTGAFRFSLQEAGAVSQRIPQRIIFPVQMRATPTVTTFSPTSANAEIRNTVDNADCSATAVEANGQAGFSLSFTGNAGSAVGQLMAVQYNASSRLS